MSIGLVLLGMGFRVFFFCMLWNEREERERESLHTRKKKDGNSRKAV